MPIKTLYLSILAMVFLLAWTSCKNSQGARSTALECQRTSNYGSLQLCLPTLQGYQECYEEAVVKHLADSLMASDNQTLGYYLPEAVHRKGNQFRDEDYDNYISVFTVKKLKEFDFNQVFFDAFVKELELFSIGDNWEETKARNPEILDNMHFDKPIQLNSYRFDQNSYVQVYLFKDQNRPHPLIIYSNWLRLRDRLIVVTYNKYYLSEESLAKGQSQSGRIVKTFLTANPNSQ